MSAAIEAGFQYTTVQTTISRNDQLEKLGICGIDPGLYGDHADITQFATDAILVATTSGLSINGNVHVTQRFRLQEPVMLDEPLTMSGEIQTILPVARGNMMQSVFQHHRADGSVPLTTERYSLRLRAAGDEETLPAGSANSTKSDRGSNDRSLLALAVVSKIQFTPEMVRDFSGEGGNLIHSDPEVARQFGFRAPIAGGLMAVRFLMAAIVDDGGRPGQMDFFVRFRRPMFWDEGLRIVASRGPKGHFHDLAILNDQDKIAVEARLHSFTANQ